MRYLGIDYGTRLIGLALSDDAGKMGFPHAVIPNTPSAIEVISELIGKEGVEGIVMGESKNLDGSENPIFEASQDFARALERASGLSVAFEPEYYTTKQARDATALAGKGSERADSIAAAIILTSYLEKHGNDR